MDLQTTQRREMQRRQAAIFGTAFSGAAVATTKIGPKMVSWKKTPRAAKKKQTSWRTTRMEPKKQTS
jgi:hypothetical protein